MKTLNKAVARYNGISLIVRILIGLFIGAVLALVTPHYRGSPTCGPPPHCPRAIGSRPSGTRPGGINRKKKNSKRKPEIKKNKGDDCLNQRPTREQVERLRRQYPAGTRITLHSMDDPQAPPPGTKGTVAYVDDMGTIGIEWDNGSALSLIPGEDSFSKEASPEKTKHKRSCDLER